MASFAITEAATSAPAGSRRGAPLWLTAYLYILPATLIMAAITYWPIIFQVYMSFTDYGLRNLRFDAPAANFVGLDNFISLITNGVTVIPNFSFWGMLAFNLFWTFSNVIFHVTIGILIAVVLNTPGLRFRGFYRAIFILPIVVPTLVVATVPSTRVSPLSEGSSASRLTISTSAGSTRSIRRSPEYRCRSPISRCSSPISGWAGRS
jgi:ABC-type sugar transport system permease subunit